MLINPYVFSSGDPYFSNVSLLLHGEGSNGSTTITDSSSSPKTITVSGSVSISTSQFKFGLSSIAIFNGTASAPASISAFGTGDFTIETWIYRNNTAATGIQEARTGIGATPWIWYINSSNKLEFFTGTSYATSGTVPSNQWVHIAISRQSSTLRQFINGSLQAENANITTNLTTGASNTLIMASRDASQFYGLIDEYRVTPAIARYVSSFTPPTTAFPNQ